MFEELLKACKRLEKAPTSSWDIPEDILQQVPNGVTAQDLRLFLSSDIDESESITVLGSAYATITKIAEGTTKGDSGDRNGLNAALIEIADRISHIILPICSGTSLDEDATDYRALQRKGELGLRAIQKLTNMSLEAPLHFYLSTLLRLVAFTDATDPWTTADSSALARNLLEAQLQGLGESQARSFIVEEILTGFLRPLFSKSRPATVTASGRKAEYVEPSRYESIDRESPETKPWKYTHRYAITVFAWAVQHADSPLLQSNWPLFTPVLLTLLDESQHTGLKIRALGIFRTFWARCPAGLMRDTGLAEVFEQAVFPAVLYLPSLTPEDESLQILSAAYPALIEMAGLRYTDPRSEVEPKGEPQSQQITESQRALLDKIIREGIMVGYHHAKEHIRLVGLLCETLMCIINGMGILAVKHLKVPCPPAPAPVPNATKDFIPMVTEIMTDPFGPKHPPSFKSATTLLQTILRTCWPRVPFYCNEIINVLMLCWLNIEDEESLSDDGSTANDLKAELTKTADMLAAVMKAAKVDLNERVGPLVKKEPGLSKLFRNTPSA
ncbi:hypothetical protein F5Y13DRAFT_198127 [Hypoxylon sp. FL1857]|nr:hypothetical protein F5Y13DRAFT_198127 [Hypoxylon sp. FL1857]